MDEVHESMSRVDFNEGNNDDGSDEESGDDEDCVINQKDLIFNPES